MVAKILVLVNLSKARAGEFVQCTATPVAGGNKDFVTDKMMGVAELVRKEVRQSERQSCR